MMATEVTAGAVVYRHGENGLEYLLLQSTNKGNFWGFPKGHVEGDETLLQTAQREIREETQLTPKIDTSFHVYTEYDLPNGNHKQMTLYLAPVDKDVKVTLQKEEIADYEWLPYDAARQRLTYDNLKDLLDKVDEHLLASDD